MSLDTTAIANQGVGEFLTFLNAVNLGLDGRLSAEERHTVVSLCMSAWLADGHIDLTREEEDNREARDAECDADFEAFLADLEREDEDNDCLGDCELCSDPTCDPDGDAFDKAFDEGVPVEPADHDRDWTYASAGTRFGAVEIEVGDILRVNWTEINGGPAIARVTEVVRANFSNKAVVRVEQSENHKLGNNAGQGYLVYPNMTFDGVLWGEYLTYDFGAPVSELDRLYGDMEPDI